MFMLEFHTIRPYLHGRVLSSSTLFFYMKNVELMIIFGYFLLKNGRTTSSFNLNILLLRKLDYLLHIFMSINL